jgi:hypothetical protein
VRKTVKSGRRRSETLAPAIRSRTSAKRGARGRKLFRLRTGGNQEKSRRARSDGVARCKHREKHRKRRRKRSDEWNLFEEPKQISRQQRHFILEKLVGQSDKAAALAAGYTEPMAANTKQKIWARPGVREEHERLKGALIEVFTQLVRDRTPASPDSGASKELPLESASIRP